MHAIVYTRVSTLDQAQEGLSLETQREAAERRARDLGAETVTVLEDAYTGTSLDRPAMNRLRDRVADGGVDLVVVYDPDRFSRDLTDLLIVTREFEARGVKIEFVNFDWERTPQGMLFLQIRGAFAQFEHAQIRERTLRGKRKKAQSGGYDHGFEPYGYTFIAGQGLVVNAETAPVVKRIYEMYLGGLSVWQVAKQLAAEGVPGPRRPTWEISTVHKILRNPSYLGRVRRKGEQDDWVPLEIPRIIEDDLWAQVQEALARRARRRPRRHASAEFLVQGLCVCGACGSNLYVKSYSRKYGSVMHRYTYYACPRRAQSSRFGGDQRRCADGPFISSVDVDKAAWEQIASVLRRPERILERLQKPQEIEALDRDIANAKAEVARLEATIGRLEEAWYRGETEEIRYRGHKKKFLAERQRAEARLRHALGARAAADGALGAFAELKDLAARYAGSLDDLDFATKRRIARMIVERIVVWSDRVRVEGKVPLAL